MGVDDEIFDRLAVQDVPDAQAGLVIAALLGNDDLARAIAADDGTPVAVPPAAGVPSEAGEPKRAYLSKITVAGFRGIGPAAELPLQPGPGLTLVTGRNGSGKSSFAEGAELALTGDNRRWSGAGHSVERDGWRNLHQKEWARIDVELAVDGVAGVTTVTREWAAGADLDNATSYAQPHSKQKASVDSRGWAKALELYRPFLSYSELGALVSGTPSKMHDALEAILGLEQLKAADEHLGRVRKDIEATTKKAKGLLPPLRALFDGHSDERAATAHAELKKKSPDLDTIAALASGGDDRAAVLRQVTAIELPAAADVQAAIDAVRTATEHVAALAGTPAAEAKRLAGLLTMALGHQRDHDGEPCPVCKGQPLDAAWAEGARTEVGHLSAKAAEAEYADVELTRARQALDELVPAIPSVLSQDLGGDIDPRAAGAAWAGWTTGRSVQEFSALESEVGQLKGQAAAALSQRAEAWRPVAVALGEWVTAEKAGREATVKLADVRKAIEWLKKTGAELRNERLAPFTETSARVWEMLRQESNVELGPVTLTGVGNRRKVSLDVTVDGEDGAALSVMSQGELHALGLALFLPRAKASASPFGFMVIDDPVQSMDPAKVDGLARVLCEVARDRQVVVFTHDDRLAAAIRALQLPATIWEVTRREQSVVTLTRRDDIVDRYICDALALAKTPDLNESVRAVAVAGLCRYALEAACVEVTRARRISAGVRHDLVEKTLADTQKLGTKLALALFDDPDRTGEVVPKLGRLGQHSGGAGQAFVRAFRAANAGAHDVYAGDLVQLVRDTEKLAKALRS